MKNSLFIIIGVILVFAFGMQVFMFYRIHEKLDQRYAVEKRLNLSSHQGSDTWIQDAENWDPYQELFQMRDKMNQLFNNSMSRLEKKSTGNVNRVGSGLVLKDESDRYVVTVNIPDAAESSLNVDLKDRLLTISVKTESVNEQKDNNNHLQRSEVFSGEFQGSLILPGNVNKEAMKTEYDDGVFTIILPKV